MTKPIFFSLSHIQPKNLPSTVPSFAAAAAVILLLPPPPPSFPAESRKQFSLKVFHLKYPYKPASYSYLW